jgi:hypothetical protein
MRPGTGSPARDRRGGGPTNGRTPPRSPGRPARPSTSKRCLGAERVGEGVLDIADRQPAHEPGDHQRLQGIRLRDGLAEQLRRERLGRAPQFGPGHGHRPGGGLDRHVAVAVATTDPGVLDTGGPLVAGPAEEHLDLGLQRRLDDQPGTEAGDVLDHLRQVTLTVEQGIDLTANAVGGRYSYRQGRSPSFAELVALEGTYVR